MTAFRPDIAVIDRTQLPQEPPDQSILTLGSSIKFVAEVVSGNWQNDYARKVEDYAALGIPEYWIADYAGLGGTRHIGKPKQPTLSVCTLPDGVLDGESDLFMLQSIESKTSYSQSCREILACFNNFP